MKQSHKKCCCLFFFLVYFNILYYAATAEEEDAWMEPDAWTRDHLTLSSNLNEYDKCSCPLAMPATAQRLEASEDAAAFVYFKKLISLLFNRKQLKYDASLERYERSLILTVRSSQLAKLENLQDPRDLDNVLTEIFENARSGSCLHNDGHHHSSQATGFTTLILDIFRDFWQLMKTSEIQFLSIATLVIIGGLFLHKHYHIGWFVLVSLGLFLFGYLFTYLECNRELEASKLIEVLRSNQMSEREQNNLGFFSSLNTFFFGSNIGSLDDSIEVIKKSSKISPSYCRPDHVLIIYFNDLFLKFLKALLEQCTDTLKDLQGSLSFPFNIIAPFILIFIIGYILKLTFKYILCPGVWNLPMYFKSQGSSNDRQPLLLQSDTNTQAADRLSGENLKMLLNVINSVEIRKEPIQAVSGVEDIREAIESASSKNNNSNVMHSDQSSSSLQDNNNLSREQIKDGTTEVKLEDVPDDSLR